MLADLLTNSGVYDQVAYISIALQTEKHGFPGKQSMCYPISIRKISISPYIW